MPERFISVIVSKLSIDRERDWSPFSSNLRLSTQAPHWDRGRPARYEHRKVR